MPQNILGIDLGSYSVKIIQLQRVLGEFKLIDFFELPLVAEGVLSYHQAASAAVVKFLSENPINYDFCAVGIPGNMVSFRTLELPFKNARKIDQTFEFELEALVPFDLEAILYDYSILSTQEESSKVLAVYLSKESFENFFQQIMHNDIDPRYLGVDTSDLSYLTTLGVLPPEGRYALLDLGHSKSNLIVLEGQQVKMLRCFSWGGKNLTEAIAQVRELSYEQAEAYKHQHAKLLEEISDPALEAIHREFEDFALLVKQTLFTLYESGESAIEALYLSGGTSKVLGIDSFFSQKLTINVSHLELLDENYVALRGKEVDERVLPNAFALALHGVFPNRGLDINFRRGEYAYKRDIQQIGGTLRKVGMLSAGVGVVALFYFIFSYWMLSDQVSKINKNITQVLQASVKDLPKKEVSSSKNAISILDGRIAASDEKLKKIQGESSVDVLQVLKSISTGMPPRQELTLDIDKINISSNRVNLEGRVKTYEEAGKVESALAKLKEFKNVKTGKSTKNPRKEEVNFTISFDVASE